MVVPVTCLCCLSQPSRQKRRATLAPAISSPPNPGPRQPGQFDSVELLAQHPYFNLGLKNFEPSPPCRKEKYCCQILVPSSHLDAAIDSITVPAITSSAGPGTSRTPRLYQQEKPARLTIRRGCHGTLQTRFLATSAAHSPPFHHVGPRLLGRRSCSAGRQSVPSDSAKPESEWTKRAGLNLRPKRQHFPTRCAIIPAGPTVPTTVRRI